MKSTNTYLSGCLYFTANALSREITRMAEEVFRPLGMCSSNAFLMMLVIETPGITQKELSDQLHLAPSTVSRFVDSLVLKGNLEKKAEGKIRRIYPTDSGADLLEPIQKAWVELHKRYSGLLGESEGEEITKETYRAYQKLKM